MNLTVLITGAGSGIGREAAVALARRGHRVIATTQTTDQAEALARAAADLGVELEVEKLDVLDPDDRRRASGRGVEVLVNNAAVGESGSLAEVPMERVRANFETNVFAPLLLTQSLVREMARRGRGRIVFMSSLAGRLSVPFLGPYCMTKFAVEAAADALRPELEPLGIRVVLVEPGGFATGFNERNMARKYQWMGPDSLFAERRSLIEKHERRVLWGQSARTDTVVRAVVRAVEARRPQVRYTAPRWQGAAIQLLRMLGR